MAVEMGKGARIIFGQTGTWVLRSTAVLLALSLGLNGCGKSNDASDADTSHPQVVSDLRVVASTDESITLAWTASGDDDNIGTATTYDIRYSESTLVLANWTNADQCFGEPAPALVGTEEGFVVTELMSASSFSMALKVSDEVGNWSGLSNIVIANTQADSEPPGAVTDLLVLDTGLTSLKLGWTAPGDNGYIGSAATYEILYSLWPVNEWSIQDVDTVSSSMMPQNAGLYENLVVDGLDSGTAYYFALWSTDEVGNRSTVSNVVSAQTLGQGLPSGNYTGLYHYIEIANGVDTNFDTTQLIDFQFSNGWFTMEMDGNIAESLRVFCDVLGEFELAPGLIDLTITDSNFDRKVCTQYWGPGGLFGVVQNPDSLVLLRDATDTSGTRSIRSLRLAPN